MDIKFSTYEYLNTFDLTSANGIANYNRVSSTIDEQNQMLIEDEKALTAELFNFRTDINALFKATLSEKEPKKTHQTEKAEGVRYIAKKDIISTLDQDEKQIKEFEFNTYNEILGDSNLSEVTCNNDYTFDFKISEKIELKLKVGKDGKIFEIVPPDEESMTPEDVYAAIMKKRKQEFCLISAFEENLFEEIENFLNF